MKYLQSPIKFNLLRYDLRKWFQKKTFPPVGKLKDQHLNYSAETRCPCGAGMAYPKNAQPYGETAYWDCSDILKGEAGEHGSMKPSVHYPAKKDWDGKHTAQLPFSMYEIKSELNGRGLSTRPPKK